MTHSQQRIAVALWRAQIEGHFVLADTSEVPAVASGVIEDSAGEIFPDYLNDLHAAHDAESHLNFHQQLDYAVRLHLLFGGRQHYMKVDFDVLHATAAQRTEVLLRTVGRWVDEVKGVEVAK